MTNKFKSFLRVIFITILVLLLFLVTIGVIIYFLTGRNRPENPVKPDDNQIWGYFCQDNQCHRFRNGLQSINAKPKDITGLSTCYLTCEPYGTLLPLPTGRKMISKEVQHLNRNLIVMAKSKENYHTIFSLCKLRFYQMLDKKLPHTVIHDNGHKLLISLKVVDKSAVKFNFDTDESYNLEVNASSDQQHEMQATIVAANYFGARHAFETLLNLMVVDELTNHLVIPKEVKIHDNPDMKYRGLLIDTVRNYIPVDDLKRTIDVMGMVKLNVLHWYIGGSQSFPFYVNNRPELNRNGRFSETQIYTVPVIKDIVNYAAVRGVMIIPEFETPGNMFAGWENTDLTIRDPLESNWPEISSQLNVTDSRILPILEDIFEELLKAFNQPHLIHLGGAGVRKEFWADSANITDDNLSQIWNTYLTDLMQIIKGSHNQNQQFIIWWDTFQLNDRAGKVLKPDKVLIQIKSENLDNITENDPYKYILAQTWQEIFKTCNIAREAWPSASRIFGREIMILTDDVDGRTIDSKLWPDLSGLANLMWKTEFSPNNMVRLIYHRKNLVDFGIAARPVQSEWCYQNVGKCSQNFFV